MWRKLLIPVICRGDEFIEATVTELRLNVVSDATLLTLADTCLLWGHRLSEWCGHGPALEEDIALTNTALDVIGQARVLLQLAAARRGDGTTEDTLAYFRAPDAFFNVMLAALPNGDYACTVARSFLLSAWFVPAWASLTQSADRPLATFASEAVKESRMQLRHATDWVIRFGDGSDESRRRIDAAFAGLWPYCGELLTTPIEGTDQAARTLSWQATVKATFDAATLTQPISAVGDANLLNITARESRVTLLAEMQSLARQHPGAVW